MKKTETDLLYALAPGRPNQPAGCRGNFLSVCGLTLTSAQRSWAIFIVEWSPTGLFLEGKTSVNLCVLTENPLYPEFYKLDVMPPSNTKITGKQRKILKAWKARHGVFLLKVIYISGALS